MSEVHKKATIVPWNNQDGGGFEKVGISYLLASNIDQLSWNRKGLWSVYPVGHIGRNTGTAQRHIPGEPWKFGTKPTRPWSLDELDFSVYGQYDVGGKGTNDFKSMKEYIYMASAIDSKSKKQVRVESDGSEAVRLEVLPDRINWIDNNDPGIKYNGTWNPATDTLEYFKEKEFRSSKEGDFAEFTFNGTGICWIGTKGMISGSADVFIDGKPEAESLSFYTRGKTGSQSIIFSKQGLQPGKHTIKIVAWAMTNRMPRRNMSPVASSGTEIPLDAFWVLDGPPVGGDVKMVINNLWNHTKMGLGNYMKDPILISPGYSDSVRFRFVNLDR